MRGANRSLSGALTEEEPAILYLAPPLAHARGKLRCLLLGSGLPFCDPCDGVLSVEVSPDGLSVLGELLLRNLSEADLRDCPAVLVEEGAAFGLEVFSRTRSLFALVSGPSRKSGSAPRQAHGHPRETPEASRRIVR